MLDADQVRQMLLNLVQNGIDAVEEKAAEHGAAEEKAAANATAAGGPGEVLISAELSPRGDMVHLRVSDTGRGMPPEVIKDIFTPFYTTKQLGKGTGMGLSIVYGVVKMHAGDIAVDSEVGRGTSFLVRIPVEREESHGHGTNSSAG